MNRISILQRLKLLTVILATLLTSGNIFATHAQSADITYQCLGNNQYQIQVSFYRDCAGVAAPNTVSVNFSSVSCNQNFNATLNRIPGTGIDVTQVCNTINTQCNGGNYPGVQEYIYRAIVTLPAQCVDWVFSFSLCCRNNAINTINTPGNENIYVSAQLNNLNFPCNNSPSFSNPPVSYPCIGQTTCFNHGVIEADGDSLYYSLQAPATSPTTNVTYIGGYSSTQPLTSSPLITFNSSTGDICMSPTMLEVTVLAVRVEEWRNGVFVGSVVRDIQLRTVLCNNNVPTVSGINGSGQFSTTACVGSTLTFTVPAQDINIGQTVTLTWNNAISGATFTSNNLQIPTAIFSWTPTLANVSSIPYCFTVSVRDDNCPLNGAQVYSFCITVNALNIAATSTTANCGASNGSATVSVLNGTAPYTYQWSPSGGNNATANGLLAGNYTVLVTDAAGCSASQTVTIGSGAAPGNVIISSTNVSCFGANNGTALANANGGQQPYTYLWSNGANTPTIQNLAIGTYQVTVTTANGCISTSSVTITQPSTPLSITSTGTTVSCFGGNNGTANVTATGGTSPYTYNWNTTPTQFTATANNLTANNYMVTVTDNNGCVTTDEVTISQPTPLAIGLVNQLNVTCNGNANGLLSVNVTGGTTPYQYNWNGGTLANSASISNLNAGNYNLVVTDANGCSQNTSYTVTQPTLLNSTISNQNNITCYGLTNGSITTSATGGTTPYTYNWSNGATTSTINNLSVGTYYGWVTDANGCSSVASTNITQPTAISTTVSNNAIICPGEQITLQALSTGGTGNLTYNWSNGFSGQNNLVSPTVQTTFGVYSTDANGCTGNTATTVISVNDINLATLIAFGDDNICVGEMAEVYATFKPGLGTYSFNWDNGLGSGLIPIGVSPNTTTNYTITVTDDCGNTLSDGALIEVHPLPEVGLPAQTAIDCGEVTFNFQNNYGNPTGSTYNWNFGDNSFSTNQTSIKTYSQTGSYTVTLIITTPFGCTDLASTIINAIVNPVARAGFDFTPDDELNTNNATLYFSNYSTNTSIYKWNFGDGGTSTIAEPVHTYQDKGDYLITLITNNNFNCADTLSKEIKVHPEYNFYIPNAFTPDKDGLNEIFTAVGEEIKGFSMQIFNRWGEKIYETHDLANGWDGKAKDGSEISQQDVYVYDIRLKDYTGKLHTIQGKVTLIK